MATSNVFGARPKRAQAEGVRTTGGRARKLALIATLTSSLVLASGFAFADTSTQTPDPLSSDTQVAAVVAPEVPQSAEPEITETVEPANTQAPEPVESAVTSGPEETVAPESIESEAPATEPQKSASDAPGAARTGTTAVTNDAAIAEDTANISPMALGPETGVGRPYLYWDLRTPTPASQLVAGGTFALQGPRVRNNNWTDEYTITDCTSAPCLGYDRDPDPGEFQVPNGATGPQGTISMSTSQRWRVRGSAAHSPWVSNGTYYQFSSASWQSMDNSLLWSDSTYGFGTFSTSSLTTRNMTITVNKGTYRTGTSATAVSGADTAGVRFGIFASADSTTPLTTCEITSSNLGKCVFPQTALPTGLTVYIKELSPAAGSVAETKLGEPLGTLTTGTSGSFADREYRIAYTVPTSGATSVTLPSTASADNWDSQGGFVADRVVNPELATSCTAGVKVAILMDLSGSVYNAGAAGTNRDAAKGFVNALRGSGSQVALFSFGNVSPRAGTANHASLRNVDNTSQYNALMSAIDNYYAYTLTNQGTNWDDGLYQTALGAEGNDYDLVIVLTDGNPTFSGKSQGSELSGSGSLTTFRELERAIFSANKIKAAGSRVLTVGIGSGLSDHNLASISGPTKFSSGMSLNDFDYTTAGWSELKSLLENFAAGLKCEATVTVEKQAKPYGGSYAAASGWDFGLTQTGATSQTPSGSQPTGTNGQASWTLKFTNPDGAATAVLTETQKPTWSLADITCDVDGVTIDMANGSVSIPDIGIGSNVKCTFKNEQLLVGALKITKAFDSTVPSGSGMSTVFTGTYACTLNSATVASGSWSRTGTGEAVLVPAAGSPAADKIPAGASCSATETALTGSDGLPNSSYEWGTASIAPTNVTIASGQTREITVTNTAKRVYGDFQITKVVPEGSVVDTDMMFSGTWECTLGGETVPGNWGPIAAGATWTSGPDAEIPVGATCAAVETRTGEPVTDGSHVWDGDPVISEAVEAAKAPFPTITVTNKTKPVPGTVSWTKVAEGGTDPLNGSEWEIVGPAPATDKLAVIDCVAADAASCTGADKDPAAGKFLVTELTWGTYTLVETKAPPGYVIGADKSFTIGRTAGENIKLNWDLGRIENEQREGPVLPLTGGIGRDQIYLAGALVLMLAMTAYGTMRYVGRRNPRNA